MKNNKMTREEKRRLLFNKKYVKEQQKMEKNKKITSLRNRMLITVLAVVFTFSGIISVLVSAFDGADYATATELSFANGRYTVPTDGLDAGLYRFTVNSKSYVFTADNHIPGATDIVLSVNADGTYNVTFEQSPTAGAVNILDYVNLTSSSSGSSYSFEMKNYLTDDTGDIITGQTTNPDDDNYYDSNPKRLILEQGKTYYFRDDYSGKYYYLTPEEDFGYNYVSTRVPGVYQPENAGDLALSLTIDENGTGTWSGSGNYYTRQIIYERATQFANNRVYLITAIPYNSGSTEYMIRYTNDKYWKDLYDNWDPTALEGLLEPPSCPNWHYASGLLWINDRGEYVYKHGANGGMPTRSNSSFYRKTVNGTFNPYTASYYYDGEDSNFQENSDDTYYDRYIYSEFATYKKAIARGFFATIATLFTGNQGVVLMGYDGNGSSDYFDSSSSGGESKGYYTSNKALGGIYTANPLAGRSLLIHKMCPAGIVAHNYGSVWSYDYSSKEMRNKNSAVAGLGFPGFLSYGAYSGLAGSMEENQADGKEFRISYDSSVNPNKIKSDIYIYEMKTVYTKSEKATNGTVDSSDITTSKAAYELENVTVTLTYSGINTQNPNKEFQVTFTLTDGDNPVVGKWSTDTLTFTNGVYMTSMKNGDTIPFTNIPKGYSLNVSVTLPDGDGDENALYYSSTIDGQIVSEKNFTIDGDRTGNNAIPIVITDTRKKAHVNLTYSGDNIEANQAFPVTLRLAEADDTPVSGTFLGKDTTGATTTFVFENGECVIDPMSNDQALDVFVPEGYNLTTTVTLPTENANYYTSSVDGVNGNTATVTMNSDEDIPIVITSVKERVTITNLTLDNPNQAGYSDSNHKFPLKLTLYSDASRTTPYSGDFVGTDGTTVYTFGPDGVCTNTVELADQESISLFIPKNMVLTVEDAVTARGYTTTYSDPSANDSSIPLNTAISNDGIQITVKHTADEIVVTGVLDENKTQGLAIAGAVIGVGMAAGVAYVYCKKEEIV